MDFERIRNLREDSDLTQSELAKQLHISQRVYSHYETGTRSAPIPILLALADYYDCSIDYLLNRTDKKEMNK